MRAARKTREEIDALIIGKKFGRLLVTQRAVSFDRRPMWTCKCDCGKEFSTRYDPLLTGRTLSCGCLQKERMTKHGQSNSRTWESWRAMRRRCYEPQNKDYHSYGARGITVCSSWLESFENFFKDMGERPARMSLDRIDTNGDYTPGNCKWSTDREQSRNKRTSVMITIDGATDTLSNQVRRYKTSWTRVNNLVMGGLSYEAAFREIINKETSA